MNNPLDRLMTLRVCDIMAKAVQHVSANQSMASVACLFLQHKLSCAPVVNEKGTCVGVISASDFLKRDACQQGLAGGKADESLRAFCPDEQGNWTPTESLRDYACDYMSAGVQSVTESTTLLEAAQIMDAQHVHRVPVLDQDGFEALLETGELPG